MPHVSAAPARLATPPADERRRTWRRCVFGVALVAAITAGCGDDTPSRALWLAQALTDDNLFAARREPALVAGKYRLMAASAHGFLRGSLGLWRRDQAEAGPGAWPTAFGSGLASLVAIVGDPHLENAGCFGPGLAGSGGGALAPRGAISLEWNDFDAAGYGPFHLDVRRLALGLAVTVLERERAGGATIADAEAAALAVGPGGGAELAAAVAEGYVAEVEAQAAGAAPTRAHGEADEAEEIVAARVGIVAADLLRRAREQGNPDLEFADAVSVSAAGGPALRRGVLEPPVLAGVIEREVVALDAAGHDRVGRWLAKAYLGAPPRLLDAARRLGAGVGSYALWRIDALVAPVAPAAGDAGPYLLELKEIADPPGERWPLPTPNPRPFGDNAERAVTLQRAMQSDGARDRFLAAAASDGVAVKIRHRSSWQKGLSLSRLVARQRAGKWHSDDVVVLARLLGRLLAAAHLRAPRADGGHAVTAIAPLLSGRGPSFVAETVAATRAALPVLHGDARLLGTLLASEGPLLGLQPPTPGGP